MPAQRRCSACQRQIEDEGGARTCTRCRSDYHGACWESHGGCVRHDCRPAWRGLHYGWSRVRWWVRWWYDRYWPFHSIPIPWHMWIWVLLLLAVAVLELFGTPMMNYKDLPNYGPR